MTLVVYGKADCSLCQKAIAVAEHLQREFGYRIEYVDVAGDAALFATYRNEIPVLLLDGRQIASGIVSVPGVRAALRAATSRQPVRARLRALRQALGWRNWQ